MVSKEDFKKVWKDSSRENILNQFYYEHYELFRIQKEISEYIKHSQNYGKEKIIYVNGNDILEILDKGE